jgi:hypothetical protein
MLAIGIILVGSGLLLLLLDSPASVYGITLMDARHYFYALAFIIGCVFLVAGLATWAWRSMP